MYTVTETNGFLSQEKVYKSTVLDINSIGLSRDRKHVFKRIRKHDDRSSSKTKGLRVLSSIFVPINFPQSVSRDYVRFQLWDTLQKFAGTVTSVLATYSVLKALGVGDENFSPVGAALIQLAQDGSKNIGHVIFGWAIGTSFDYDSKKWWLFAALIGDLVLLAELCSTYVPSEYVIYYFCVTRFLKASAEIAESSARTAAYEHQARMNNSADLRAKDLAQEECTILVGLGITLSLLPYFSEHFAIPWTLFAVFSVFHIVFNYFAARALQMEILNDTRLLMCLNQYLKSGTVPKVEEVNDNENLIWGFGIRDLDVCKFQIEMGVSVQQATGISSKGFTNVNLVNYVKKFHADPYILIPNLKKKQINVIMHQSILPEQAIEAYVKATVCAHLFITKEKTHFDPHDPHVQSEWEIFRSKLLEAGHFTHRHVLRTGKYRSDWLRRNPESVDL